jgi:hypothetical protein
VHASAPQGNKQKPAPHNNVKSKPSLALADPISDGVNSVGDLVTNPVPTIGKGIGQVLTGGKGLHPDTQNTDWGPPDRPSKPSKQGSTSLHTASQAKVNQANINQAKTDFFAAKDTWRKDIQDHASPQKVAADYQKMQAASNKWRQLSQQGSGQTSATGKPSAASGRIQVDPGIQSTKVGDRPGSTTNGGSGGSGTKPGPGTKPSPDKRDKLNAIAVKITGAVLNAALTSLANGNDPGPSGMAALNDCLGQADCPLDESEQAVVRESMAPWMTATSDDDGVEGDDSGDSDGTE